MMQDRVQGRQVSPTLYVPALTRLLALMRTTYVPVSGRVRDSSVLAWKVTTLAPDGANTVAAGSTLKGNPPVSESVRSTVAPMVPLNVKRSTWAAAPMVPHTRSPQPRAPPV